MNTVLDILKNTPVRRVGLIASTAVMFAFLLFFNSLVFKDTESVEALDFKDFPMQFGDWKGEDSVGLDIRSLDILKLSTYVRRRYTNSAGESVFLYIGYWATQSGEYQAAKHSPALCLPSNGWQTTSLSDTQIDPTNISNLDEPIVIRRLLGTFRKTSEVFHYWFFAGNKYYSQEWYALIKLSISNLLYGRNDGGIVEISSDLPTGVSQDEALRKADQTIDSFKAELIPYLHDKINSH